MSDNEELEELFARVSFGLDKIRKGEWILVSKERLKACTNRKSRIPRIKESKAPKFQVALPEDLRPENNEMYQDGFKEVPLKEETMGEEYQPRDGEDTQILHELETPAAVSPKTKTSASEVLLTDQSALADSEKSLSDPVPSVTESKLNQQAMMGLSDMDHVVEEVARVPTNVQVFNQLTDNESDDEGVCFSPCSAILIVEATDTADGTAEQTESWTKTPLAPCSLPLQEQPAGGYPDVNSAQETQETAYSYAEAFAPLRRLLAEAASRWQLQPVLLTNQSTLADSEKSLSDPVPSVTESKLNQQDCTFGVSLTRCGQSSPCLGLNESAAAGSCYFDVFPRDDTFPQANFGRGPGGTCAVFEPSRIQFQRDTQIVAAQRISKKVKAREEAKRSFQTAMIENSWQPDLQTIFECPRKPKDKKPRR